MVCRAKTVKILPDHQAVDVDSLSDLGLFNLPRAAGWALMSMAEIIQSILYLYHKKCYYCQWHLIY